MSRTCSANECDRTTYVRSWCKRHYEGLRRSGKLDVRPQSHNNNMDIFWLRVDKTATCWLWTGSLCMQGYGKFSLGGKYRRAHILAYQALVGPVPEGFELDHLCRVRRCVNPACLEAVTHRENMRRGNGVTGLNVRKTHCKRGHPFDEENTYLVKRGRECRICRSVARKRFYELRGR